MEDPAADSQKTDLLQDVPYQPSPSHLDKDKGYTQQLCPHKSDPVTRTFI